jgi:hypothetical protein
MGWDIGTGVAEAVILDSGVFPDRKETPVGGDQDGQFGKAQ